MHDQSKLTHFQESKTEFTFSKYLLSIPTRSERTSHSKLRLGVLKLEIEAGRKNGLDRSERKCKICKSDQLKNEAHFLFVCEPLNTTRGFTSG